MSEDYAKGFKDGFAAGLEEGKKLVPKDIVYQPSRLDDYIFGQPTLNVRETCPKCGIKIAGVMGFVCSSINCPIQYRVTSDVGKPMTAVSYTTGIGHNLDTGLGKAIWK